MDLQVFPRPYRTFVTFDLQVPVLVEIDLHLLKSLRSAMMIEESYHRLPFPYEDNTYIHHGFKGIPSVSSTTMKAITRSSLGILYSSSFASHHQKQYNF